MAQMEEIQGGVVASAGILFVDRRFGSVAGTGAVQQPYHGLHGEAELEGPTSRE